MPVHLELVIFKIYIHNSFDFKVQMQYNSFQHTVLIWQMFKFDFCRKWWLEKYLVGKINFPDLTRPRNCGRLDLNWSAIDDLTFFMFAYFFALCTMDYNNIDYWAAHRIDSRVWKSEKGTSREIDNLLLIHPSPRPRIKE